MKSTCPHCGTSFRVDPSKIPAGGVRARCSVCQGVFEVAAPGRAPAPATAPSTVPAAPAPVPQLVETEPAPPPAEPSPVAERAESSPGAPGFGAADPHSKARRLARALISDIAVYHPERRERSLREGSLRQEFREEIRKSWEEYVAQVGEPMARSTPYFREALNDILAGGSTVF